MPYRYPQPKEGRPHEDHRGASGANLSMVDTPVGLGAKQHPHMVASYTGEQLRRGQPAKDARANGLHVPQRASDQEPVEFPRRTAISRPALRETVVQTASKPTAAPAHAAVGAETAPAVKRGLSEIVRPFAESEAGTAVALDGLRTAVTEILREHGVHVKEQSDAAQNGIVILSDNIASGAARRSTNARALVNGGGLAGRIAKGQPDTHTQPVLNTGAEVVFLGARKGYGPNIVALRSTSKPLTNEATAATRSLATAADIKLPMHGATMPLAEVAGTGIPPAAETPIRHAVAASGLLTRNIWVDPSPAFGPAEGAVQPPVAPPTAQ